MKVTLIKLTLTLVLTISVTLLQAQPDLSNSGIIYRLSVLKNYNESIMAAHLKSNSIKPIDDYLRLKSIYDGMSDQFIFDMAMHQGNAKNFEAIDQEYKYEANNLIGTEALNRLDDDSYYFAVKANKYIALSMKFYSSYASSIPKHKSGMKSMTFGVSEALSVIGTAWGIYKDVRQIRANRVEALSTILKNLKLSPLKDLAETKKENKS